MTDIEKMYMASSSVIAFITLLLTWKTKNLTDVVEEMKDQTTELVKQNVTLVKQTSILTDRLNLEINLSNTSRFPCLIVEHFEFHLHSLTYSTLILYNIGQYATHYETLNVSEGLTIRNTKYHVEINNYNRNVQFDLHHDNNKEKSFNFTVSYKDGFGNLMKQHVDYVKPNVKITPNELFFLKQDTK